ncbi:MAG: metallophosphoesterase [Planctomycetes bacterium]|nr:metallophosphoesterase [Planctomycetota bacterium]
MSAPLWIQQAEGWCASVENSSAGVMLIGAVVTLGNALVYRALRKRLKDVRKRRALADPLQWTLAFIYWLLLAPMVVMAVAGHAGAHLVHHGLPTPLAVAGMAFQFAVWVYGGVLLLAWLPGRLAVGLRRLRRALNSERPSLPMEAELADAERRQLLRKVAFGVPAVIVTTAAVGGVESQRPPVVKRVQQRVGKDSGHLRGFRIVQFSDVHIGSYLERDRLGEITTAINSLRPDMVVCTGDLIDNDVEQLEQAQRCLRNLKSSRGTYMCMGNHEYIAAQGSERTVKEAYKQAGATMLVDEAHRIDVGGAHFWLGGTDFPGVAGGVLGDRPTTRESMNRVLADMDDDGRPRIVLAHHPKTFFEARERQIDLMLSGHTHGGQISLGRIEDCELTPNLPFEFYHKGWYDHHGRHLYVNSGIGSWLPVRLNCPPEITLIELV